MTDMEDDWFYESIKSYKTLQMYDLQMEPKRITKVNDSNLCLAGTHTARKRTEIMCIKLPKKLLLPAEEKGRCKGNDFDIISGGFYDAPIHKIGAMMGEKLLASFKGKVGLSVLNLGSKSSNVIREESNYLHGTSLDTLNFAIKENGNEIFASRTVKDPIYVLDCGTGQLINTSNVPELFSQSPGEVLSTYSSQPILINTSTGCVASIDNRSLHTSTVISKGGITSLYTLAVSPSNMVSTLSATGQCELFDIRFPNKPTISGNLNLPSVHYADPKLVVSSNNRLSISGFGNCAYVFKVDANEFRHVFTHKGHSHSDTNSSDGLVTDHLWLPIVSENFLVSCCDNGTLNCWEYRV